MSGQEDGLTVTVRGARKRDAGRGIVRVPQHIQSELNVLSGDPVLIAADDVAVAKVWPGDIDDDAIRIDADTRASIGTTIGAPVTVRRASVDEATAVTLQPADETADESPSTEAISHKLVDRLVSPGKRVRIQGYGAYVVTETLPQGSVKIIDETAVTIEPAVVDETEVESSTAESEPGGITPETGTTYEDIGGLDDELDLIREMIDLPLSEPELFARLGVDPPTGVLLYGPPGTGKTLIARAVANEVDAYFDVIDGPEIVSKYKGQSEERLRSAFEDAEENAPSILFVDEIDSIAGSRDDDADMENRVVAQLLTLMDGLESQERVIVIGATNRADAVDPALRRGGRFDREIEIGVPDEAGRREILDVHARDVPLAEDVDLDTLAAQTHGFVGADLETLVREAAMATLREDREDLAVTQAEFEAALASVDPSAMREYVAESPKTTFADVGGLQASKRRLREGIEWPISYDPLFDAANTQPPTGVLLHGPPGTGKTLLARAIAGETGVNFVKVDGPEVLDRYVGESEEAIREVFERARQTAPAIVFLDEIDAIAGQRGGTHEVTQRVVSQLLAELDRAADHPALVVLAATNRKDALDPALLRPGRLERHVRVPEPDEVERREILEVHTTGTPLGEGVDVADLAKETAGFSGAELEALVREASMRAIREVATDIDPAAAAAHAEDLTVKQTHFAAARETLSTRQS